MSDEGGGVVMPLVALVVVVLVCAVMRVAEPEEW